MEIVADALTNPPDTNRYDNIKSLLINRCQDTEERRLDELLNKIELGDLKPSELYRHMETLAGGNSLINKSLLNKLWLNKLPLNIQPCIIAIESSQNQETIFNIADKIYDSTDRPKISAVKMSDKDTKFNAVLCEISDRLERLETRNPRNRSRSENRPFNRKFRSTSRNRPKNETNTKLCWYHFKFKDQAKKCFSPCAFKDIILIKKKTKNS